MRALATLTFCIASLASVALAQTKPAPVLLADKVNITRTGVLSAAGHVEVFFEGTVLKAKAISYDSRTGAVTFSGPLILRQENGLVIHAQAASLDPDLRNGVLRSAQMVLKEQLQLSALQIDRVEGRYNQLYKTVVTSCQICESGKSPLWQIRARRIVHDQEAQQLYFEGAQLRIRDVPIIYIPRLRLPDPSLERATGFLIPSIRNTSELGTGIKLPYFIRIGDHKDLTLTPYIATKTTALEFRYRQAYRRGKIEFTGALARDQLRDGTRYYLFSEAEFELPRDFELKLDIETSSDSAFLQQYGYSDKDRLDSALTISRTRRNQYISAGVLGFHSLRDADEDAILPSSVIDGVYNMRYAPSSYGGEYRFELALQNHRRSSNNPIDGIGRDVMRLNGEAMYHRSFITHSGLRFDAQLGAAIDLFETRDDAQYAGGQSQILPQAAITLRYPLAKTLPSGTTLLLEPFGQVNWIGGTQLNVANDESRQIEFDEGNLLSLSRFPAEDRREHGLSAAVGLRGHMAQPNGWSAQFALGQIIRETALSDVSLSSGLSGLTSDLLLAGQIQHEKGLSLSGRALFDQDFSFSKMTVRGDWSNSKAGLGGTFLWLANDAELNRTATISELTLDGFYNIDHNWTLSGRWRYDIKAERTARAGLGLQYQNECLTSEFSVERRLNTSSTVEPSTRFSFTIRLEGFSAQTETKSYHKSCS